MKIKTSFFAVLLLSALPLFAQTSSQSTPAPQPVQAVITQNTSVGGISFTVGQEVTLAKDPGKGFTAQVLIGNRQVQISTDYIQVKASAPAGTATSESDQTIAAPVVILKATYGVPGTPLQQVASKLRGIIIKGNVSSANPIRLAVNDSLAFQQNQSEATYRGSITQTGHNTADVTLSRDARPVLTVVYTVGGQQKMQTVAYGDTLVLP
jgi:hypothetical protein